MTYWEIIADKLSKAGWSWGCLSAIDFEGRTIWITDAHRGDGKRFVVHSDEKLTASVELESAILQPAEASSTFALAFQLLADFHISQAKASKLINNVLFTTAGVEVESCR